MSKRLYFYPDYSGGNPYQKLLYKPATESGWVVTKGSIEDALNSLKDHSLVVFHMHWLNAVFIECKNPQSAWDALFKFISGVSMFKSRGGKLIWTIHNHIPHENLYSEQDLRLRHFLSEMSDRIHLHCGSHIKELTYLPIKLDNVQVHRHGSYLGYYGDFSIEKRLKNFNINNPKALFLGMLRNYKNTDKIIEIAKSLRSVGVDVTIAGKPEDNFLKDKLEIICEQNSINYIFRRLSESEVHELCVASDIGILSYEKILTSGTIKLYMSYGMQIIAPSLPTINVEDRFNSFIRYSPDKGDVDFLYVKKDLDGYYADFTMSYFLAQEARWSSSLFHGFAEVDL